AQTLVQQVQRDAMTANVSTNGTSVFAVREWPSESLASSGATPREEGQGQNQGSRFSRNRLLSYDLATGQQQWELRHLPREWLDHLEIATTNDKQETESAHGELPSVLFLGPPLAVLSHVYA